jgi:hypothetical protein
MIEKKMHLGDLFAVYGPLLTDKQQEILNLSLDEDYSLGEIAEILTISRQAVNDVVKKAEKAMENYELKLAIIEKTQRQNQLLEQAKASVETHLSSEQALYKELQQILDALQDV